MSQTEAAPPPSTPAAGRPRRPGSRRGRRRAAGLVAVCLALALAGLFWPREDMLAEAPLSELQRFEDLGAWPAKLVEAIDLDHPGLEAARAAHERGDTLEAAGAIVDYFAAREAPFEDKRPQPVRTHNALLASRALMAEDEVTVQNTTGRLTRKGNGRIDWTDQGPRGDREWKWMLNRLPMVTQFLMAHDFYPLDEYIEGAERIAVDWITARPKPWYPDLLSSWRALEAARRLEQPFRYLLAHHPRGHPQSRVAHLLVLASVAEHAEVLRAYHAMRGNHLLTEMTQLLHTALLFPEFEDAPRWKAYALEKLHEETGRQIYPDGAQKELTNHYQQVVLRNYAQIVDLLERAGMDEELAWFRPRVETMGEYLAWITRPDGTGPLNNDSDLEDNAALLGRLGEFFGRADWEWIATGGASGERPSGVPSRYFPWAGHAVMHSGWERDSDWGFFDMGFHGIDHQHDDRLHVSITAGGLPVVVDNGRYTYRSHHEREAFAGAGAHNLLRLDGEGTCLPPLEAYEPVPAVAAIGQEHDFFRARARFLAGGAHVRAVLHGRGRYWLVCDGLEVFGHHRAEARWHFHPDVALEAARGGWRARSAEAESGLDVSMRLIPIRVSGAAWRAHRGSGWYSEDYNRKEAAPRLSYRARIDGPAIVAWLFVKEEAGVPEVTVLEAPPGSLALRLDWPGGSVERVVVRLFGPALPAEVAGVATSGEYGVLLEPKTAAAAENAVAIGAAGALAAP